MATVRLHADEIPIDQGLVERLVATRFPHYTGMPLSRLGASGSSNVLFRLCDERLVRLPRQPGGGAGVTKERTWLPWITPHLPVAVPRVLEVGEPAHGYSECWSIVSWLDGEPATAAPRGMASPDRSVLAAGLADFILALRATAIPESARRDPALRGYRGRALAAFDTQMQRSLVACRRIPDLDLDLEAAARVWAAAMRAPDAGLVSPPAWYHGDLVAENLLLQGGRLSAVLDFGGLALGDPVIDLHGAWELFDADARGVFRARLGVNDADWARGRSWALAIALGTFPYYWTTMPQRRRDRLVMARAAIEEALQDGFVL